MAIDAQMWTVRHRRWTAGWHGERTTNPGRRLTEQESPNQLGDFYNRSELGLLMEPEEPDEEMPQPIEFVCGGMLF